MQIHNSLQQNQSILLNINHQRHLEQFSFNAYMEMSLIFRGKPFHIVGPITEK